MIRFPIIKIKQEACQKISENVKLTAYIYLQVYILAFEQIYVLSLQSLLYPVAIDNLARRSGRWIS